MNLDSRDRIHLEWMFENQPDLCRQLHQQNKLGQHLDRKMQEALRVTMQQKDHGLSEDEAFQQASDLILTPSDGPAMSDNPPKPLPLREQEAIYKRLEA